MKKISGTGILILGVLTVSTIAFFLMSSRGSLNDRIIYLVLIGMAAVVVAYAFKFFMGFCLEMAGQVVPIEIMDLIGYTAFTVYLATAIYFFGIKDIITILSLTGIGCLVLWGFPQLKELFEKGGTSGSSVAKPAAAKKKPAAKAKPAPTSTSGKKNNYAWLIILIGLILFGAISTNHMNSKDSKVFEPRERNSRVEPTESKTDDGSSKTKETKPEVKYILGPGPGPITTQSQTEDHGGYGG